ncbi:hypothetical protein FQP88_09020 [Vibrio atlanticus]|nr:hypothetical protein FQP88_09020 [Vibrio atlanticus]
MLALNQSQLALLMLPKLIDNQATIVTIIATFSFTMLGFMITALAVIVGISDRQRVQDFRHFGLFGILGEMYLITLLALLGNFVLSSMSLVFDELIVHTIALTAINILQIIMVTVSSYILIFRSSK